MMPKGGCEREVQEIPELIMSLLFRTKKQAEHQQKEAMTFSFTHMLLHWYSLGPKPSKDFFQGLKLPGQDDLQPEDQ